MQRGFSIFDVLLEMLSGHGACVTRIDVLGPSVLVVYNHRINNGLPSPLHVVNTRCVITVYSPSLVAIK